MRVLVTSRWQELGNGLAGRGRKKACRALLPSSLQLEGLACKSPQREGASTHQSAAEQAGSAQAANQLGIAVLCQAGVLQRQVGDGRGGCLARRLLPRNPG